MYNISYFFKQENYVLYFSMLDFETNRIFFLPGIRIYLNIHYKDNTLNLFSSLFTSMFLYIYMIY